MFGPSDWVEHPSKLPKKISDKIWTGNASLPHLVEGIRPVGEGNVFFGNIGMGGAGARNTPFGRGNRMPTMASGPRTRSQGEKGVGRGHEGLAGPRQR